MGAHLPAGAAAISPTDSPHAAAATEASPSTSAAPHGGGDGGGGGGAKLGGGGLKQSLRREARAPTGAAAAVAISLKRIDNQQIYASLAVRSCASSSRALRSVHEHPAAKA